MPHVNIWIRKADYDKWIKLPNKPEAISKMLRGEALQAVKIKETVNLPSQNKKPVTKPVRSFCAKHNCAKDVCKMMKH